MVGIYSGPLPGNPDLEAQGAIEQPYGSGVGASFGEAFSQNITPRLLRETGREFANTGVLPPGDIGAQSPFPVEPEPTMSIADANQQYGIKGVLNFDAPVPESVAQDLYEHHRDALFREDVMQKAGVGAVAQFSTGIAASLLDPFSVAAAFVPGVGEERAAQLFGGAAFDALSAAGRAGARVVAGASSGLLGTAALQPVEGLLANQEKADFTMTDALRNIAFGTVLGGGLHVVGGAVGDRLTGRYANPISQALEDAGPETRETLLRGAIAQLAEGRQVDVGSAFDAISAGKARDDLIAFGQSQQRIEADTNAALDRAGGLEADAATRKAIADSAQARLMSLQNDARQLQTDLGAAKDAADFYADPTTADRLAAIQTELGGRAVPAVRRAQLEAEQTMLTEGSQLSPDQMQLEQARSEAEARALASELLRNQQAQQAEAGRLGTAQGEGAAFDTQGVRALQISASRLSSRQAVLEGVTARSVRQLAARLGVGLDEGEDTQFARQILLASTKGNGASTRAVADVIKTLGERRQDIESPVPMRPGETPVAAATRLAAPLDTMQRSATQDMLDAAKKSYQPSADQVRISRIADEAARDLRPDTQRLESHIAELEAAGDPSVPADARESAAARDLTDAADARAAALEQAATCVAQGMAR